MQGALDGAIGCFEAVLRVNPGDYVAMINLAGALGRRERHQESVACYRRVLAMSSLDPNFYNVQTEAQSCLAYASLFDPEADARAIQTELVRWNQRQGALLGSVAASHNNDPSPERRLRIGYVSADFRDHVLGRNILPLFRHHDHAAMEIFCYSNSDQDDAITREFRSLVEHFQNIAHENNNQAAGAHPE